MKIYIVSLVLVFMGCGSAFSQNYQESDEYNPIFNIYDTEKSYTGNDKVGYIKLKLENILSKDTEMLSYWLDEFNNRSGHFFMLEKRHKLDNGYTLIFTQFRSNLTCGNYKYPTRPNEGDENCYTKLIIQSPEYRRVLSLDNIWMDGYNDIIYIRPDAKNGFGDILINDIKYEFSSSINRYIPSSRKN